LIKIYSIVLKSQSILSKGKSIDSKLKDSYIGKVSSQTIYTYSLNLNFQGHLGVVEEPILNIEGYMMEALYAINVAAHIQLGLKVASKLKEHSLLGQKPVPGVLALVYICHGRLKKDLAFLNLLRFLIIFKWCSFQWYWCRYVIARDA
jgi:hypothetical protein